MFFGTTALKCHLVGVNGRTKAIEMSAGHTLEQHCADLGAALERPLRAFDSLDAFPDAKGWQAPIAYRGGMVLHGGLALWRELVIHASDLGTGLRRPGAGSSVSISSASCSRAYLKIKNSCCSLWACLLRPLVPAGSIVISGMVTDIAAWLAGREPTLGSLRASAAADSVDLPELLPWPSGLPTP